MKTNENLISQVKRTLLIIGILILLALLVNYCGNTIRGKVIEGLGGYTKQDTKVTIDTVEVRTDSIFFKYDSLLTVVKTIKEPKVITKYVPKYINSSTSSSNSLTIGNQNQPPIDRVYSYLQPVSDSILEGNIHTIIDLSNCKIIEQSLKYQPKIPIFVNKYITIEKTIEKTISNEPKPKIGVGALGSTKGNVGILGVYQTAKSFQYQVGFNKNVNNIDPNVKSTYTSNGEVTLSIIKLF